MPEIKSDPAKFKIYAEIAKRIISNWPEWKRKTRATSYPRPYLKDTMD